MNILSELIIIRNYLMDIKVVSLNNHYSTYNNLTLDNLLGTGAHNPTGLLFGDMTYK